MPLLQALVLGVGDLSRLSLVTNIWPIFTKRRYRSLFRYTG